MHAHVIFSILEKIIELPIFLMIKKRFKGQSERNAVLIFIFR